MPNLLIKLYDHAENLKGKQLYLALASILLVFTIVGLVFGNVIGKKLKENEAEELVSETNIPVTQSDQFDGKVVYIDPRLSPQDKISYFLAGPDGKELVMLKATDEKLAVVEGLEVKVFGTLGKTSDGKKEVLMVDRVIVKNK